jgi:hypothetical protein
LFGIQLSAAEHDFEIHFVKNSNYGNLDLVLRKKEMTIPLSLDSFNKIKNKKAKS